MIPQENGHGNMGTWHDNMGNVNSTWQTWWCTYVMTACSHSIHGMPIQKSRTPPLHVWSFVQKAGDGSLLRSPPHLHHGIVHHLGQHQAFVGSCEAYDCPVSFFFFNDTWFMHEQVKWHEKLTFRYGHVHVTTISKPCCQTLRDQRMTQHHRGKTPRLCQPAPVSSSEAHVHCPCSKRRWGGQLLASSLGPMSMLFYFETWVFSDYLTTTGLASGSESPLSRWRFSATSLVHKSLLILKVGRMWPKFPGTPSHFIKTVSIRRVCQTFSALSLAEPPRRGMTSHATIKLSLD